MGASRVSVTERSRDVSARRSSRSASRDDVSNKQKSRTPDGKGSNESSAAEAPESEESEELEAGGESGCPSSALMRSWLSHL
jgi:hypothetical protein